MKKIVIITLFVLSLSIDADAQKISRLNIPPAVQGSFAKQYAGIVAKWEKEEGKYEANFIKDGNNCSAMYEPDGTFTGSEIDIKISDLPKNILTFVKEHYPGKKIKEAAKITKADGTVNYEAAVGDKDVIFDAEGKFLKEQKE
jgi:hypothetical protein